MVEQLLDRLIAFGLSIPTNLVILLIVCIIMKAMGKKWSDCVRVIIIYLFAGLLLSMFGITMPNFIEIGTWIGGLFGQVVDGVSEAVTSVE